MLNEDDSSIVTGVAADEKGGFLLKPVPYGSYPVKIGTLGYNPYFVSVKLERGKNSSASWAPSCSKPAAAT